MIRELEAHKKENTARGSAARRAIRAIDTAATGRCLSASGEALSVRVQMVHEFDRAEGTFIPPQSNDEHILMYARYLDMQRVEEAAG